ncbi:MAG: glycosyltransferase family 4 protein [Hyphomicrobiaceae bacterium]
MRIAYVCSDHGIPVLGGKGASIHIQELIGAFHSRGHEIELLCARMGHGEVGDVAAAVTKIRAAGSGFRGLADEKGDGAERRLKEQRYIDIGEAMEAAILERHARTPFDFIYERYSLWSTAGVHAAQRLGIPCVVEVNAPLRLEQQRYRKLVMSDVAEKLERDVFSLADIVVCVSEDVRDYAVSHGATPSAAHVMANAVDLARFNPQASPANVPGASLRPLIGFVGSLKPWHGIQDLLEAFRLLRMTMDAPRLLIVGDGPMRSWIEGFAQGAGLIDDVLQTGWAPYSDLPSLIRRMHVATAPYPVLEECYFSPLKVFEYMAVGRPIVASNIGQVGELIEDGCNGILTKPGDPESLAAALRNLLVDKTLASTLGANAAVSAQQFTWAKNAARVEALVDELLLAKQDIRAAS